MSDIINGRVEKLQSQLDTVERIINEASFRHGDQTLGEAALVVDDVYREIAAFTEGKA